MLKAGSNVAHPWSFVSSYIWRHVRRIARENCADLMRLHCLSEDIAAKGQSGGGEQGAVNEISDFLRKTKELSSGPQERFEACDLPFTIGSTPADVCSSLHRW